MLTVARESPDLSSRQLAAWITDNAGLAVSESTVYRIPRREGLVKRQETQLLAANELPPSKLGGILRFLENA